MKRHLTIWMAAALTVVLVAAGCSSDSSDGGSEGAGSDAPSTALVAEADEIVSAATERPTAMNIDTKIQGSIPQDGTLYFVECGAPACAELGDKVDEVAKSVGWESIRIQAGLTPETIKDAWQQVVNSNPQSPAGVIASGFPKEIFASELATLEAEGIPVVNISVNDDVGDGLTAVLGHGDDRNTEVGRVQAAWVVADSEGTANTVFVRVAGFPTQVPQSEAFETEYARLCPDCEQDLLEVATESMGTTLPQDIAAYLQSNPDVDYVVLSYGDMAIGVPSALKDTGAADRVRAITDTPNPTVAQYIADDNVVVAATAYPGPEMVFSAADIIFRSNLDEEIETTVDAQLPLWLMTSETIPSTTESFPIVESYREDFEALWNL